MPIYRPGHCCCCEDVVHALYNQRTASLADQQAINTDTLVKILRDCSRDAEQTIITDREYLKLMGFSAPRCEARELWQHLVASMIPNEVVQPKIWQDVLTTLLEKGPLRAASCVQLIRILVERDWRWFTVSCAIA